MEKKRIRQAIAFLAIGLLLLAGLNWLARLPGGEARERDMRAYLTAIPGKQALIVGPSIADTMDLAPLCLEGINYHLAQDFFEMRAVIDFALMQPRPPRLFIVVIAPTIQSVDNGSPGAAWPGQRERSYRALYGLGYRRLIGGDWRQAITANLLPALGDEAWRPHARWLAERLGYRGQRGPTPEELRGGRLDPAQAELTANGSALNRAAVLRRTAYYTPGVPERATAALVEASGAIQRSGGRLIIVVPPMIREAREATARHRPADVRQFPTLLSRLAASGATIRNHWADPRFDGRYDLFRDVEHLNTEGGALFSRLLAADLRASPVLERDCAAPN